ncbi:hypothetical protein CLOP_g17740 [Closterium sp. NIES-67]|nr:hypothetical protein CLOP_g17740 [Closterium sp. NIES-67]
MPLYRPTARLASTATTWPTATGDRGGARTPRGSGPGRRGLWTRHFLSGSGSLPRGPSVGCCSTSKLETGSSCTTLTASSSPTAPSLTTARGSTCWGTRAVRVTDSRFVGLSPNYGNPRNCDSTPQMCGPVTGCEFPLAPGQQGRSQGWSHWKNPLFGIIIDQPTFGFDFSRAHAISNCRFHAFDSTCRPAAAIGTGINGAPKDTWATATSIAAVQGTDSTNLLFFPPRNFTFPGGDVNGGSEATDLYTLWDRDGSFLNASLGGYLVANNSALLPPTKRFPACRPVPAWNAYACPGTCYRTVMFTYLEPGFSVYENSSVPDTRKRGDFSYLSIRRIEDDAVITVDGNLRSVGNMWAAGQRIFVVPLLANATYEVNVGLPSNNQAFFPSNITVQVRDSNGCGGPVTLRIPARQSNQWAINEEQDVNWKACLGTADRAALQFSFVCFKFKPTIELLFDGSYSDPVVLRASPNPVVGCRLPYRCGLIAPESTWAYDVSGRELHAAITGAMGFSSPRFNDASWPRGPAIIGYVGWRWNGVNTWTPPSGDALPTFYYRRAFKVASSACVTGLFVDVIVNDGVLLYLNGVEMLRVNMAPGPVNVSSRALSNQNVWDFASFFIPLNATAPFSLAEGTNYIAAESHAAIWTTENFFDLKLSAQMDSATCSGVLILQEVCDGLDNNNDGKVDIDPLTDLPLTRPCRNPCGAGVETCIEGAFQNCTAPVHGPEVCNGVDDNCDGLVDNSPSLSAPQLDCANGSVCFKGQCLPVGPLTVPLTTIAKGASGWLYYDKGYLPQSYPTWSTNTNVPARLLKEGAAPFGFNTASAAATNLSQLASGDSAYFFLKSFPLTEEDVNNTWSYSASIQRDDGALLLMNGAEFFRTNMPAGPITASSFAAAGTWGPEKTTFYNSTAFRSLAQFLQPGTNWLAVQLHQSRWSSDAVMDLELTRHAMQPCSALPGSPPACVRTPPADTLLLAQGSSWAYNDASLPAPPPDSWYLPSFDDSAWLKGATPIAAGNSRAATNLTLGSGLSAPSTPPRVAYYFRRTFAVSDAACNVALTVSLNIADGAVVYLNGVEAYRFQMQPAWWGPITPTTTATGGYVWRWVPSVLSGGWVQQGANVIAVEVHQQKSTNTLVTFDVQLTSKREAIACTPSPL